ncbi:MULTISPECIES: hypothetical protein [unclassified Mucilaginibacter]|uniref:hypothetical protein n=1 Tax=unclassified Mucilaginibacter TaxID=2617802 RepID=UPI0031F6823F
MLRIYFVTIIVVIVLVVAYVYALVYFSSKPADLAGVDMRNVFHERKTIPVVVQKEILTALSHYPELKDTPIDFVFDPNTSKSIMLSQPVLSSFFRGRLKRSYVIKINPRFKLVHRVIPIQDVPKNVLVGWFGHELGHVMDYRSHSNLEMIGFGIRYISSDKYIMRAEQHADAYAIDHGLGDYIVSTKNFILTNSEIPPEYRARIQRLYPSPQQVIDLVKKLKKHEVN